MITSPSVGRSLYSANSAHSQVCWYYETSSCLLYYCFYRCSSCRGCDGGVHARGTLCNLRIYVDRNPLWAALILFFSTSISVLPFGKQCQTTQRNYCLQNHRHPPNNCLCLLCSEDERDFLAPTYVYHSTSWTEASPREIRLSFIWCINSDPWYLSSPWQEVVKGAIC